MKWIPKNGYQMTQFLGHRLNSIWEGRSIDFTIATMEDAILKA
jgi:hypothetical protein